jgi:hypothetical protein
MKSRARNEIDRPTRTRERAHCTGIRTKKTPPRRPHLAQSARTPGIRLQGMMPASRISGTRRERELCTHHFALADVQGIFFSTCESMRRSTLFFLPHHPSSAPLCLYIRPLH